MTGILQLTSSLNQGNEGELIIMSDVLIALENEDDNLQC